VATVTKAEQAARDAVAAFVAEPSAKNEAAAWDAVHRVSLGAGWWHQPTACVWFAYMGRAPAARRLIPVALGTEPTRAELRFRLGLGPKPESAEDADAIAGRLRRAEDRAKYLSRAAREIRRKFADLQRVVGELGGEVDATDVPDLTDGK